jgi:hypothetical protein
MAKIFCDEPIIACYNGRREYDDIDGDNAWFDVFHDIAYHVTEGHRIVLETEHFYISLSHGEVTKTDKTCTIKEFEQDGEWLDPFVHDLEDDDLPWVEYESTLFVGERVLDVQNVGDYYLITFDDFELKLIPHKLHDDDFPSLRTSDHWSYNYVLGAERHLTSKCNCGGEGELLLDFVSDYVVRCKKCKHSTYAQMIAKDAIDEWNAGHIQCDLSDIVIE